MDEVIPLAQLLRDARAWAAAHVPNGLRIVLILVGAFVLTAIARQLVARVTRAAGGESTDEKDERRKRTRTLERVLHQSLTVLVWVVAGMLLVSEMGVDLGPILAGAGIAGLALGIGGQTLVKDVISGCFILVENQFRLGDVIATAGVRGNVEAINLRTTLVRDMEGRVHIIPNGAIDVVTNFTRGHSRALLDVGVAYKEDTDRCFRVLREVGASMESDPVFGPKLLGPFEYPGVERFDDSAVVLRMLVDTRPQERWNVLRELRRRVKKAFDANGIEIPFPHRTLYLGEGDSSGKLRVETDANAKLLRR